MASTETGQMFTEIEYEKLPDVAKKNLVKLTPEEEQLLKGMDRRERRAWLRANKKKELKEVTLAAQ